MENLLERAPFSGVLEDYGPKSLPIKSPRRLVRVKKFRVRTNFSQTFDERRLARGNPARYSDGRHTLLYSTPARDEREQGTARPRSKRQLLCFGQVQLFVSEIDNAPIMT